MITAEHQVKTEARAKAQAELRANIQAASEWADQNDVRTIHIRSHKFTHGGVTVVFRKAGFNFIDLAVSHCSSKDMFNKKIGRSLAITNLRNGQYIKLRVDSHYMKHNLADLPDYIISNMEILFS